MTEAQEIERLRNVLRMQREWIRHWRDDVKHNLRPTLVALADAEDAIVEALKRTRTLETAE